MQIDAKNRHASMSVGEFASFLPYATPGFGGISAAWRAQIGTDWHQRIQAESIANDDGLKNEVPISGTLDWRGWKIQLNGRIDQSKQSSSRIYLREIKTVSEPLPISRERLLERYPSYPIQLLTYRELLIQNPESPLEPGVFTLDLLFVEIGSGLTQTYTLDQSYDTLIVDQLDSLIDSLESQVERLKRLRSLSISSAYESPRPGQETIQFELEAASEKSSLVLLEAPTGYGKTGVAWEYAARRLASGREDRILYLTSKTTGQTEAVERLRSLLASSSHSDQSTASFWHIRNKQEHCIHSEFRCSTQTCPYLQDLHEKWKRSGLQRLYLLSQDEYSIENLKAEGRATGICPYEIMRAGLGHRDIWIGDYNYLFSPHSARLLDEQPGFDPARTFLIVDEAHNLASRVTSNFTHDLESLSLFAAAENLRESNSSRKLQHLLKSLANLICSDYVVTNSELPDSSEDDLRDHLSQLASIISNEPLQYEDLLPETTDLLFSITAIHSAQKRGDLEYLMWSPSSSVVRLECINAAKLIREQINRYSGLLALSATLSPLDSFLEEIGLESLPYSLVSPPAPWREGAYDVAIDLRIDTRYKTRDQHLNTTVSTIAQAADKLAPTIVFFPSYAYAEKAFSSLQHSYPFIRVILQPRSGGTLSERSKFLEEAIAFNDVIFLILGSSYAEGVDSLGGKAGIAIIVSPALPEMNLVQNSKRKRFDNLNRNGFERAYLIPGIQKVNQALGRLIRAPGQKVKILLHCERFADPKTKGLLDPLYRTKRYLNCNAELTDWLG